MDEHKKNDLTSLHLVFYVQSIDKFTKRTDLGRATAPVKAKEKDEEGVRSLMKTRI